MGGRRIGEIWFEAPEEQDLPLLAKFIFTSEKLSIQVHPDDEGARAKGLPSGKSECWYILAAEPGARIALGLRKPIGRDALRLAALDGSIEDLLDWKPVRRGDFYFVPAGTIHAIGAGISLFEFQQNTDVTYRLYDYGRPRELHLDEAVAASKPEMYREGSARPAGGEIDAVLVDGPHFTLCRANSPDALPQALASRQRWVMPLEGSARSGPDRAIFGECLLVGPGASLQFEAGTVVLVGATASGSPN